MPVKITVHRNMMGMPAMPGYAPQSECGNGNLNLCPPYDDIYRGEMRWSKPNITHREREGDTRTLSAIFVSLNDMAAISQSQSSGHGP